MSLVKDIQIQTIDDLIQVSLENKHKLHELRWIPYSQITDIESSPIDNIYYAIRTLAEYEDKVLLILVGNDETCTPSFVSEFARIYSLPTEKYKDDVGQFRRYSQWMRNSYIMGFTKHDGNCYMVACNLFYHHYFRYGFCPACGILRCGPVWCICGHKELSDGWTSNNKRLDEFIKKSQMQTNSANDAYLEWIPFACIYSHRGFYRILRGLPTAMTVKLIPLDITDEADDSYFDKLCDEHPDILNKDVWLTIGLTYDESQQKYCLIKDIDECGLCLGCTWRLNPTINAFCYECISSVPLNWTTGNKALDLFIMKSWSNVKTRHDAYIQWIEYSLLTNVQETTSLRHGCTRMADWLEPAANEPTKVTLKRIVDGQNAQSFDFYQLTEEYPSILTPDNIWVLGITQETSTQDYYLVFYNDVHALLDKFIQSVKYIKCMQYTDFDEIEEIASGGYGTIYTAKYERHLEEGIEKTVVLKRFKHFDQSLELFISEFRNHAKCTFDEVFLLIYGYTQHPETAEYIIVMQYANSGNLLAYLDQNINRLTWRMKLECLYDAAYNLGTIHYVLGSVHCDLHGGNILLHNDSSKIISYICDLSLTQSVNSCKSKSMVQGALPFIAPEVFHTRKFTQKSDIYSFGIIMYLMATGEPPFQDKKFDSDLMCDILGGLRPLMPDSAPEEYKELAQQCCDADPDKRPNAGQLWEHICGLITEMDEGNTDDNMWNAIYHKDSRPIL